MPLSNVTSLPLADNLGFSATVAQPGHVPVLPSLWSSVDHWQRVVTQKLEHQLNEVDTGAWDRLKEAARTVEALHEESRHYITQWLDAGPADSPALKRAYQHVQINGALADAALQQCLGTLTLTERQAVEHCLAPLLEGQEPPQAYLLGKITLRGDEVADTWSGALTLTTLAALTDLTPAPRVLLYRFGVHGGWSTHESSRELLDVLSEALGASPSRQVVMTPAAWTTFDDTLEAHLLALATLARNDALDTVEQERAAAEARDTLSVPVNPPLLLALAQVEEIYRSVQLAATARRWLPTVPAQGRAQLAGLITDYASALVASHQLLKRDLPTRTAYVQQRVFDTLVTRFNLNTPCSLSVRVPLRVDQVRDLIAGSGAPGTPTRLVPRPSDETELISLETLALEQIDDMMAQRLGYLELEVVPATHPQAAILREQVNSAWLMQVIPELDVAGGYERLLADAYLRAGQFQGQAEDEAVLLRPYALMLDIQCLMARLQGYLDAQGERMFKVACEAHTPEAWRTQGLDVRLRPASLTVFDERSHTAGSPLAGVVFIQDSLTDCTLLFIPGAADSHGVRQYATFSAAQEALENLFLDQRHCHYLCSRALEGDPRYLQARVSQGLAQGFRELIAAGDAWPAHQSLPRNQYLAEMGLQVRAHRATSTSNADWVFDAADRSRADAVRYIRLALGFVPFVGSLIALADAVEAGLQAGEAFVAGDSIAGLEATQSVLLSITDALFDVGPGALVTGAGVPPASLMATARARQLRQGMPGAGRWRGLSSWSHRRGEEAFAGYPCMATLTSRPAATGRWQAVYQETAGTFILRKGSTYAVEWDASHHTWRLAPTATRTYRQPIALDENGQWQTHGHLYGTLLDSGLHGGGGVQSYLADRLDPLWPDLLRRLLPRWWIDAHFRRQQQLLAARTTTLTQVIERETRLQRSLEAYQASEGPVSAVLHDTDDVIQAAITFHEHLDELRRLVQGRRNLEVSADQSRAAATVCAKSQLQIKVAFREGERVMQRAFTQREDLNQLITDLYHSIGPDRPVPDTVVNGMKDIRSTLSELLALYDQIDQGLERLRLWQRRVTLADHRRQLHADSEVLFKAFSEKRLLLLRVALLMDLAPVDDLSSTSWSYIRRQYGPARERYDRVAQSLFNAEALNLNLQQRQRLQRQVMEQNTAFTRLLRRLSISYPHQFDPVYTERLLDELRRLREAAPATAVEPVRAAATSKPKLFESDGLLLVGEPVPGEPDVLVLSQVNNRSERWARRADRTWAPATPPANPAPVRPMAALAREAQARLEELPALRLRLKRYATPHTLGVDLEDLYLGESQELALRIRQLHQADPDGTQAALVERLQQEADALRAEGRQARIDHCKATLNPTGGQLEYLVEANEVQVRKAGHLQPSGTTSRTRNWLQEYEVVDRQTDQVLFYAHFHYGNAQPRFGDFAAAHLKTPAQRLLGTAPAGEPPVWRGEISRKLAAKVFHPLFR